MQAFLIENFDTLNLFITIFFIPILFIFSFYIISYFNLNKFYCFFIFIYHILFSFIYLNFIGNNEGDVIFYIESSRFFFEDVNIIEFLTDFNRALHFVGTNFILLILSILDYLTLGNFLLINLIFNFFSFLGILIFLILLSETEAYKNNNYRIIIYLLLLLPSLHFFTSSLGKDSLSFFLISLSLFLLSRNKFFYYFLTIFFIFLVRPYLGFTFLITFILANSISADYSKMSSYLKILFAILFVILIIPFTSNFIGYDIYSFDLESLVEIIKTKENFFISTDNFITKTNNIIFDMFIYNYRINFGNLLLIITSLENLILLFLLFIFIIKLNINWIYEKNNFFVLYLLISSISIFFIYTVTTFNYGIIIRQKWQFELILSLFMFYSISSKINEKKT